MVNVFLAFIREYKDNISPLRAVYRSYFRFDLRLSFGESSYPSRYW